MDRFEQKNDLLVKLGALFGPLQKLAADPDSYDEQETAEIIARYCAEHRPLIADFDRFCHGQAGHVYMIQHGQFNSALNHVPPDLRSGRELNEILADRYRAAKEAIAAVPVPRKGTILETHSPFSTYCKLRDLIEGDATTSVVWVDAYMSDSLFHRYLRHVDEQATVCLAACEPHPSAGNKEKARWNAFLDVSRLYAAERGPSKYRLVVHGKFHDRWLLLDDKRPYIFGGSAKDASATDYFSLACLDASPENLAKIKERTDTGTEYFGPNEPNHK